MKKIDYKKVDTILKKLKEGVEISHEERMLLFDCHREIKFEEYNKPLIKQTKSEIGSDIVKILSDGWSYKKLIEDRINFLLNDCNQSIDELSRIEILDNYLYQYDEKKENQQILENHFQKVEKYYLAIKDIIEYFKEREEEFKKMYG